MIIFLRIKILTSQNCIKFNIIYCTTHHAILVYCTYFWIIFIKKDDGYIVTFSHMCSGIHQKSFTVEKQIKLLYFLHNCICLEPNNDYIPPALDIAAGYRILLWSCSMKGVFSSIFLVSDSLLYTYIHTLFI